MLIGDQGFGDTIQFCRYIPDVAKICPEPDHGLQFGNEADR